MKMDDLEIIITYRKIRFLPTNWTGEKGQKPNKEIIEQEETEPITVAEAIKRLSKYL